MRKRLASFLLASALAACSPKHASFVHVDDVALGRIVIYRNGVAFYERRATVVGGQLQISVPRDRVDDFLKSLTVVDALTQEPLPVSIPRQQAGDGDALVMTLQLPNTNKADVVLTYVTEAPAWKPSYRVVVGDNGKVMLEGWAIVDNTSGEDWRRVIVGVGSSSALSFKYDLWSVRQVARETLAAEEKFAVAPPSGVAPFGGEPQADGSGEAVLAVLGADEVRGAKADKDHKETAADGPTQFDIEAGKLDEVNVQGAPVAAVTAAEDSAPRPPSMPASRYRKSFGEGRGGGGKAASPTTVVAAGPTSPPPIDARIAAGEAKLAQLPPRVLHSDQTIVINASADGRHSGAATRANERANVVKNELIDKGIAPARIRIVTNTDPGAAERVQLVAEAPKRDEQAQAKAHQAALDADAQPVGESHFASPTPMTVERGSSAMVSMVRRETAGEVVYLYDAESERGNDRFAFRAVRFQNPTDSTLETGPVTVYGNERFIGEGLTEPIAPHATALVPYALDRQIVVDRQDSDEEKLARLVTLERGILTAEVQHLKHRRLVITNRLPQPAKVFLRHTVAKGWNLVAAPPREERIGDSHLFEVDVAPGAQQVVEIAEATPMQRTLDLSADGTLEMIRLYLESPISSPELKTQIDHVLALHKQLADLAQQETTLRRQRDEYRERMDELHGQIVTLQAVKTGGDLMTHLKDKMRDVSDRVQKATIAIVDTEEKMMLGRVKLQDALSELTLPDALAKR